MKSQRRRNAAAGRENDSVVLEELLDPDELSRFDELDEEERTRVIIRVLCGLVALEESQGTDPVRRDRVRRLLPFLGFEDRRLDRHEPPEATRSRSPLPRLGLTQPLGETKQTRSLEAIGAVGR